MHLPMTPYEDAGPLYGLVLPILISLSVAPSSYFLWANATPDADNTAAVETPPKKLRLLLFNMSSFEFSLCSIAWPESANVKSQNPQRDYTCIQCCIAESAQRAAGSAGGLKSEANSIRCFRPTGSRRTAPMIRS